MSNVKLELLLDQIAAVGLSNVYENFYKNFQLIG